MFAFVLITQNFVTGFDGEFFTLSSLGDSGRVHVEAFEDVEALEFKIAELERQGHEVLIAPVPPVELYRYAY